jgi:hypothetical protein
LKIQVAIEDILNPNPNQLQFDFGEDDWWKRNIYQ